MAGQPRKSSKTGNRRTTRSGGKTGAFLPWRGAIILLLLLASLGALAYLVFLYQPDLIGRERANYAVPPPMALEPAAPAAAPPAPPAAAAPPPAKQAPVAAALPAPVAAEPAPEIAASAELAPILPASPVPPALLGDRRPLVAIIIDDMGYRPEIERQMLALDLELTFSFIPFSPYMDEALFAARRQNRDILLHLPLEAIDPKWSSTPGMLLTTMSPREIAEGFAAALAEVPMAVGLNNHMGSRFTPNAAAMNLLLQQAAHYDLFFLDSLTTAKSVGREAAERQRVPFLRRDVFLDNEQEEAKIRAQLEAMLKIAETRGYAIGIGHSYPETLLVLQNLRPEIEKRVRLVGLSQLYHLR